MALIDVITGVDIDKVELAMGEKYRKEAALKESNTLKRKYESLLASAPESLFAPKSTSGTSVFVTLFSFLDSKTGSASYSPNNNHQNRLDRYGNDSVSKFAGSSIMSIAVLVMALLAMQMFAYEKQERIVGILRIMGMSESAYWISWTLAFAMLSMVGALVATAIGNASPLQIFTYCDFGIHFIALWLYLMSMMSLIALFVSFVKRPMLLNLLGLLIFLIAIFSNAFFGNILANMLYRPDMPNVRNRSNKRSRVTTVHAWHLYSPSHSHSHSLSFLSPSCCSPCQP